MNRSMTVLQYMKHVSSRLKPRPIWLALPIAICLLATLPPSIASAQKGKGKGGGGNFVSVLISFDDLDSDRIQSDGWGDYYDGEQKVLAVIDSNGGFRFDTGGAKGRRKVRLDFSHQALPGDEGAEDLVPLPGLAAADFRLHDEYELDPAEGWVSKGPLNLLDMQVGDTKRAGFSRGTRIKFDPNPPGEGFDTGIAYPAVVKRLDDGWSISSPSDEYAASFMVVGNDWNNPVLLGYFHMPFEMKIRIPIQ